MTARGDDRPSDKPKLHSVAIELTPHCNQKCSYCYNPWREDNGGELGQAKLADLTARVTRLLDAFDVDHVTLTGGEPFSRNDVFDILALLKARGVGIQIISNGGLITPRLAAQLQPFDVSYVQITLNGPDAELHERHVGPGHFDKTLQGIAALREISIPVVGCIVVTRLNAKRVGAILERFAALDVRHIALSRFSPAGFAVAHAAELLPSRGDLIDAFDQALPFARDRGMSISCTMPVPPCMLETEDYAPIGFGHCPIGTSMQEVALGPDGRLKNCTLHDQAIGGVDDILDEAVDLVALMQAPEVTAYRRALPAFCDGCVHASSCGGGCGAAAQFMLGLRDDPLVGQRRLPDPVLWQHVDDDFEARLLAERRKAEKRRLEVLA
ncbi:MAG: radical SAM protein [Polyangiaceae bacterium]